MPIELPSAASVTVDPDQAELRSWAQDMPTAVTTSAGNIAVTTRVTARSAGSTYIVADDPTPWSKQTMPREEFDRLAALQDEHIAGCDMVLVRGYIGPETSPFRVPAQLYIERSQANIPAMQQQLYYPPDDAWDESEAFTVVYTPSLVGAGYPGDRVIAIDLDAWVTRVVGADYFGESKMGGLRMWNEWVYQRGGLAMHSGAKVVPTDDGDRVLLIVGLSGTGKTTTTFTRQNDSLPVQDDFVALAPGGAVHSTEDGCFAKTIGLDPDHEPTIHAALTSKESWLENVAVDEHGTIDFDDASHTANGRGTFTLEMIPHRDPRDLGTADALLILNRNESIVPAVARMNSVEQAVAYFMLGETKGTSAGGAAEAGRFLRVPGTNPFFLRPDFLQGNRLAALIRSMSYDFTAFVLSTGRVGGGAEVEGSKDVTIEHSSAIVRGIAERTITWERDPDFGYDVAVAVPGVDDVEVLQPRRLYERLGREEEYAERVAQVQADRRAYIAGHAGLEDAVAAELR